MRIIDADELERRIREAEKIFYNSEDVGIAIDCVDATKTISEWHYPSRGEYPPNNKWVFVYLNDETCTVGLYCSWAELKWIDNYENEIYYRDIVAWQYIIPPKEEA